MRPPSDGKLTEKYILKKKNNNKKKTGGFVLLWLIKNNAYFSLQHGSAFCPRTLLLISNLTRRRNGLLASFPSLVCTVTIHVEVSFPGLVIAPDTLHIHTPAHRGQRQTTLVLSKMRNSLNYSTSLNVRNHSENSQNWLSCKLLLCNLIVLVLLVVTSQCSSIKSTSWLIAHIPNQHETSENSSHISLMWQQSLLLQRFSVWGANVLR